MPTIKVVDMTARTSSSLAYDDYVYLTSLPTVDEKMQASVLRDYALSGIKTSADSGLAQTSTPYAVANPEYELTLDVNNLPIAAGTADVTDYVVIEAVGSGDTKKILVGSLPFVTAAVSDVASLSSNLTAAPTTGAVKIDLATTLTGLTSVTSTTFVGALTGNADTATTAVTVTGATQAAITSAANLATVGTITSGVWNGTAVGVTNGGTGLTTVAKGAVLVSDAADTLSALSGVTDGDVLTYTLATDTIGWATPTTGDVTEVQGTTPITITDGTGPVPIVSIDNTAVTPGTYNHATVTVDAKGRITGASSGTPGDLTAVLAGTGITVTNSTGPEPTVALTNTDVGYGGVTVALGASDATPAFDLVDSTNYEGSAVMSTGEVVTTKFLRTDGDNTSSWQIPPNDDTTYSAGDGLDLTGTTFSTDLKVNSGLVIDTTELSLDLDASSITGTLGVGNGGTGIASIVKGSVLVANAIDTLSALSGVTDGDVLTYTSASDTVGWGAVPSSGDPAGTAVAMAIALGG